VKSLRLLWVPAVCAIIVAAACWWWTHRHGQETGAAENPVVTAALQDKHVIARGRYLTLAGDCVSCHTRQGGQPFAGGRALPTPFGNIPVPNITPDPETGLGNWRFGDFWRALHVGVGRQGELLYPAFSYTSFTRISREDAIAIFAYLRSLPPVHQPSEPLGLRFPYNVRGTLTAWRAMYFKPGAYQPDPGQSASWNRGAYLVQGLGHCNECHATRDAWGGIDTRASLSGGQIPAQNWYAPDLSMQAHGGLQGWSRQDIVDLLKTGQASKGVAFGPMADVVASSTQYLSDTDLHAIADYLQSLPARVPTVAAAVRVSSKAMADRGAGIYEERCAACHRAAGDGVPGVYPPLDGNATVLEPTGINATRAVLLGGFAPTTAANPRPYSMPPYAQLLSDADVADVVTYIRQAWSNRAAAVPERDVIKYRHTPVD
jgi:mono/diheme cytochrome c family protein